MPKKLKINHKLVVQFIKYSLSGGVYFWVGYLLLDLFFYVWHWNLWWSTIVSSVIGWVINYALQAYWVFDNPELKNHKTTVTTRYFIITVVDWLINYAILLVLKNSGITPAIGQFFSAGFFTVWNYLWYKYWVFPEKFNKKKRTHTLRIAYRPHGHHSYRRA